MARDPAEAHRQEVRRRVPGGERRRAGHRRRRVHDPRRAVRLREVHAAADDRRPGGHHLRRHDHRRQAGQRPGAAGPQPVHGVPELRALPAPDRVREHRVPAAAGQGRAQPRRRSATGSTRPPTCSSCDEHLERKPANLSGGQRQRVAMGRAIVRQADAFLFDEPLSNLDAKLRGQMRTEIARLQRRLGITTVYVTHDQTEAMTLGDRVCGAAEGHDAAGAPRRASSTTSRSTCSSPASSARRR